VFSTTPSHAQETGTPNTTLSETQENTESPEMMISDVFRLRQP
jgi:hypothetical protein